MSPARIPPPRGQKIDLTHGAESYRLEVFAVGSWHYRVHCDGRVVAATLREEGAHTARLVLGERSVRVLYDRTESGLRQNINVGVLYVEAWLSGSGCVPLYDLMEDAATAEISKK